MEFWVVVMVCLPVLYLTGSLRRAVASAGVSGLAFVLYFLVGLALSLQPSIFIFGIGISVSGAYLCIAPCVYLGIKRQYTYRFFISAIMVVLFYIATYALTNTYALPFLRYAVTALLSLAAILVFKEKASLYVPALAGVYSVSESSLTLAFGLNIDALLFSCHDFAVLGVAVCLFASYAYLRPRGKHRAKRQKLNNQSS